MLIICIFFFNAALLIQSKLLAQVQPWLLTGRQRLKLPPKLNASPILSLEELTGNVRRTKLTPSAEVIVTEGFHNIKEVRKVPPGRML